MGWIVYRFGWHEGFGVMEGLGILMALYSLILRPLTPKNLPPRTT